ncbi:MAG: FHA domain-containing protein [Gammaproteobacteria bacterium]|nr:FHA domain-containing protein [Gammaproteobacteria bacterium]
MMNDETSEITLLFANVAGADKLYRALGEDKALSSITFCLDRLADIVKRHNGCVIDTQKERLMSSFSSPDGAFQAACDMQSYMDANMTAGPIQLAINVAFHFGLARVAQSNVRGEAVAITGLLLSKAKTGQILTSAQTTINLSDDLVAKTKSIDLSDIEITQGQVSVFEVKWHDDNASDDIIASLNAEDSYLWLRYQDQEVKFGIGDQVTIGRELSSGLVVDVTKASRLHATVMHKDGKFYLLDQSSNGTFVRTQDGKEVYLEGEELMLWGTGVISLGQSVSVDSEQLIAFLCQEKHSV